MKLRAQPKTNAKSTQNTAVAEAVLSEICENMYRNRKTIYAVNFGRGIFFGIGSALGGTVVVAIILWVLSLFIDWPLVGDLVNVLNGQ